MLGGLTLTDDGGPNLITSAVSVSLDPGYDFDVYDQRPLRTDRLNRPVHPDR